MHHSSPSTLAILICNRALQLPSRFTSITLCPSDSLRSTPFDQLPSILLLQSHTRIRLGAYTHRSSHLPPFFLISNPRGIHSALDSHGLDSVQRTEGEGMQAGWGGAHKPGLVWRSPGAREWVGALSLLSTPLHEAGRGRRNGGGCKGGGHASGAICAKGGGPGGMDWVGALSLLCTRLRKAGGGRGNGGAPRGQPRKWGDLHEGGCAHVRV